MLILTRKTGESIMIGDDVTVTILGVIGAKARIGIAAPQKTPVHREEVYERIQMEKAGQVKQTRKPRAEPVITVKRARRFNREPLA